MSTISNFFRIKFRPFSVKDGSLVVRNYFINDKGKKESLDKSKPKYSHYEIVFELDNPYYGKYEEYLNNGYIESFLGDYIQKDFTSIDKNCFVSKTTSYTLAYWVNINNDNKSPDLKLVGSRLFDLSDEDKIKFINISEIGQREIEKILNDFDEYNF